MVSELHTEAQEWLNRTRGEVHGEFACNGR